MAANYNSLNVPSRCADWICKVVGRYAQQSVTHRKPFHASKVKLQQNVNDVKLVHVSKVLRPEMMARAITADNGGGGQGSLQKQFELILELMVLVMRYDVLEGFGG